VLAGRISRNLNTHRRLPLAQKTLAPHLIDEDKKVGVVVAVIGVVIAFAMAATVYGLTAYHAAFYAVAR
jgi:hypothetical protein